VKTWCDNNNLKINSDKSKYMIFNIPNNSHLLNPNLSLYFPTFSCKYLNDHCICLPLEKDNFIKYLGVYFDFWLKFIEHIQYVNNITRNLLFKFQLLKNMLDIRTLRIIYLDSSWLNRFTLMEFLCGVVLTLRIWLYYLLLSIVLLKSY